MLPLEYQTVADETTHFSLSTTIFTGPVEPGGGLILQALGEISYANLCVLGLTFDLCHKCLKDSEKFTAPLSGVDLRPKNGLEGVKICCLGGFSKSGHTIYQSTRIFVLIQKKMHLMSKKIKS